MLRTFKYFLIGLLFIYIPYWVFGKTGLWITPNKLAYVIENKHILDWYGIIFDKYLFPIICTISLWINLIIINWAVPIISWIKNTR